QLFVEYAADGAGRPVGVLGVQGIRGHSLEHPRDRTKTALSFASGREWRASLRDLYPHPAGCDVRVCKFQGERTRSVRFQHVPLRRRNLFQRRESEWGVGFRSGTTRVEFLEGGNTGFEYVADKGRAGGSCRLQYSRAR